MNSFLYCLIHSPEEGWERTRLEGGHFLMLAEPDVVAEALVGLVRRLESGI